MFITVLQTKKQTSQFLRSEDDIPCDELLLHALIVLILLIFTHVMYYYIRKNPQHTHSPKESTYDGVAKPFAIINGSITHPVGVA